jgi:hypothetical protein
MIRCSRRGFVCTGLAAQTGAALPRDWRVPLDLLRVVADDITATAIADEDLLDPQVVADRLGGCSSSLSISKCSEGGGHRR